MKLKTIEIEGKTYAEVEEGNPVYVEDDGTETRFDAKSARDALSARNAEAKSHRERAAAAESRLKVFEGIEDPEAARKALQTVSALDEKQLVDSEKAREAREAAVAAVREDVEKAQRERDEAIAELDSAIRAQSFSSSEFIAKKVAIPADLLQDSFGRHFKREGGRLVAQDSSGNTIYSKSRPGEVANFDEAMEQLINAHPRRDAILLGSGSSGSGAQPGAGRSAAITKEQFAKMGDRDRKELFEQDPTKFRELAGLT
jgi:hypothetical protein